MLRVEVPTEVRFEDAGSAAHQRENGCLGLQSLPQLTLAPREDSLVRKAMRARYPHQLLTFDRPRRRDIRVRPAALRDVDAAAEVDEHGHLFVHHRPEASGIIPRGV